MRSLMTPAASMGGAAVGGALAGPGGAAIGSGIGYAGSELYALRKDNEELVEAITHGDVEGIVRERLNSEFKEQQSGFDGFVSSVKKILYVAGGVLLAYLAIPFLWTNYCVNKQREQLTRGPFPIRPDTTGKDK